MRSKLLLVGIALGATAACGGPAGPEPRSPQPPPTRSDTTTPSPPAAPATPPTAVPSATAPVSENRRKDERIAGVKHAMDEAEVEQARLAEQKSANSRVRDFATGLIAQHECASERQAAILDRYDMAPVESEESAKIRAEAQKSIEALKARNGAEFDDAFLDAEVAAHNQMLERVHDELIPNTQNEALRAELVEAVPQATSDVREVYDIRRDLAAHPRP